MRIQKKPHQPKPKWLARKLPVGKQYQVVRGIVSANDLTTVCQEANCPNQFECYSNGSATFMILGESCTRNCRFCNVRQGERFTLDQNEPERVAEAVLKMSLRYVVITSVTRDDLDDGGASIFAQTIRCIREKCPDVLIEVLIPDLLGDMDDLQTIIDARPDVLNHNVETVKRLYDVARPQAIYERSLQLLKNAKIIMPKMVVKSGLMVGLGEADEELSQCMVDIHVSGCDLLIIGQYLQPSADHLEVQRYVTPEQFEELRNMGLSMGFKEVMSGPLVRSSYRAEEMYKKVNKK